MEVIRMKEFPITTSPRGIQARFLVSRKDVQVINLVIQPGQVVEKHVTPVDVLFYVVEGRGAAHIAEETREVEAQDLVVSPANIPHGLSAAPDSVLSVLVIKTPNPIPAA